VAAFIASQREDHGIPHATACRALGVSQSWFYKWRAGVLPPRAARRERLKAEISRLFCGHEGTYGAPRITADLRDAGWTVSQNTVAQLMREQGLAARRRTRRRSTTRPARGRWRAPDLVKRDFAAERINQKWYGDGTEIRTAKGTLHLASVLNMASRRVVGFALSEHHNAALAYGALAMAVAVRGGSVPGVIMHTDQGSEYTAGLFRAACGRLRIRQSMGRPGLSPGQRGDRGMALYADLRAAVAGNLCHQGSRPSPGCRLDRPLQPAQATLRVRHAQPSRLRAHAGPPPSRVTHRRQPPVRSRNNGGGCAAAGLAEPAKDTGPPLRPPGCFASRCARPMPRS
jgi:putative transposase